MGAGGNFLRAQGRRVGAALVLTLYAMTGLAGPAVAGAKPDTMVLKPHEIALSSRPVPFSRGNAGQKIFGEMIFRSGFVISSSSPYWGGLSGISISRQGRHAALVSDAGIWARLDLTYDKNRLERPMRAQVGPILALKGKPLRRNKDRDAEAITLVRSDKFFDEVLVSFEDNHRVGRFRLSEKDGLSAPRSYLKMGSVTSRLRGNAGLEALAVLQGGGLKNSLVAISQSKQDRDGNYLGWLVRGSKISRLRFTPPPADLYRITDAVSLGNGDMLLLERRYKFLSVNIRVRYVRQAELVSGRPIKGRVVMTANNHDHRVDNMEGIAAHTNGHGETIVTLISDDNFNSFQQTLLMQFALPKNWQTAWRKSAQK